MDRAETWSRDEIQDAVCGILAEVLEKPIGAVQPESLLDEGLGADSMALIEAQVGIEEHFGVVMPDIDEVPALRLESVEDLVHLVAERLASPH